MTIYTAGLVKYYRIWLNQIIITTIITRNLNDKYSILQKWPCLAYYSMYNALHYTNHNIPASFDYTEWYTSADKRNYLFHWEKRTKPAFTMTWTINHILIKEWDVITYPWPAFNGALVKPFLKSRHGWVFTSHENRVIITCPYRS